MGDEGEEEEDGEVSGNDEFEVEEVDELMRVDMML